jgi:nucleotide-binding universal stress UspA family protein
MKMAYGEPADKIVAEAKEGAYDLIVVGSRGLGPLGQLLFGSVSARVVKTAPCSVLVAGQDLTERVEPTTIPTA